MAYVPVPNDLSRIKTKLAFNLTKRQLICFSIAGGIGIPFYLFTRSHIGNSTALFLMIGLMMPCFLFAMFEKDGLPFEKVLRNICVGRLQPLHLLRLFRLCLLGLYGQRRPQPAPHHGNRDFQSMRPSCPTKSKAPKRPSIPTWN